MNKPKQNWNNIYSWLIKNQLINNGLVNYMIENSYLRTVLKLILNYGSRRNVASHVRMWQQCPSTGYLSLSFSDAPFSMCPPNDQSSFILRLPSGFIWSWIPAEVIKAGGELSWNIYSFGSLILGLLHADFKILFKIFP